LVECFFQLRIFPESARELIHNHLLFRATVLALGQSALIRLRFSSDILEDEASGTFIRLHSLSELCAQPWSRGQHDHKEHLAHWLVDRLRSGHFGREWDP
jgi:hypothetical protein